MARNEAEGRERSCCGGSQGHGRGTTEYSWYCAAVHGPDARPGIRRSRSSIRTVCLPMISDEGRGNWSSTKCRTTPAPSTAVMAPESYQVPANEPSTKTHRNRGLRPELQSLAFTSRG